MHAEVLKIEGKMAEGEREVCGVVGYAAERRESGLWELGGDEIKEAGEGCLLW